MQILSIFTIILLFTISFVNANDFKIIDTVNTLDKENKSKELLKSSSITIKENLNKPKISIEYESTPLTLKIEFLKTFNRNTSTEICIYSVNGKTIKHYFYSNISTNSIIYIPLINVISGNYCVQIANKLKKENSVVFVQNVSIK